MEINLTPIIIGVAAVLFLAFIIPLKMVTIKQGTVGIVTRFGKYKRTLQPGLSFINMFFEGIYKHISIQNRSSELKFQAITVDQANVFFTAMLLYSVSDSTNETIQKVAFKFNSVEEFTLAINKSIESSVRSLIASKKQADILSLRQEIVTYVKNHLDPVLADWGYSLIDLQVNDITFDAAIRDSMAKVVASANLKAAAENEGQALLIQKTKAAEAEGNAIKISAEAEKIAAQLRGEGVAAFRKAVAEGIKESAKELQEQDISVDVIMFSMWTEGLKQFAEAGKGNVIFLDGSPEGMRRTMQQMGMMANNNILSK